MSSQSTMNESIESTLNETVQHKMESLPKDITPIPESEPIDNTSGLEKEVSNLDNCNNSMNNKDDFQSLNTCNNVKHEFKAEISQLMNLIINTFYSNKDIFLRELISNASDALDKIRFEHLKNNILNDSGEYLIKITPYKKNNILVIEDSGIGMTKEDLANNLGMIANSGTKQFMEMLSKNKSKNIDLIGQFGVGFYSAYLVSERVQVISKNDNSDKTYIWDSTADGEYTISELVLDKSDANYISRGSKIILHLKDSDLEYLEEHKITEIIKTHSQFISYNINLLVEKEEVVKDEEIVEEVDNEADGNVEEGEDDNKSSSEKKITVKSWNLLNKDKPIWCKSPSDVSDNEYKSLYKNISNDWQDCACYKHFSAEGSIEFSGIVYIPSQPPFQMFQSNKDTKSFKLYAKRVFIMDNCEDLVPEWLSFTKGVIDSSDLPLNVSREMLQHNKIIKIMRKKIISNTLDLLSDLSKDEEKYNQFYKNFSKNIKLGIYEEDSSVKEKIAKHLRFYSNKSDTLKSLDDYITDMKTDQKNIYYITGESKQFVENSVFLERLNAKGYEVLYLIEPIDEYMTQNFKKYNDYEFVSVTTEGLKLNNDEEKVKDEEEDKQNKDLCSKIKEILDSKIEKVIISDRIVNSPCCLVTGSYGWSANMERIMKAQALGDNTQQMYMAPKKIMEINPNHNIIKTLKIKLQDDEKNNQVKDIVALLYDISCISSGFAIDNANTFSKKFYNILEIGMGCETEDDDKLPDIDEEENDNTDIDDLSMEQVD